MILTMQEAGATLRLSDPYDYPQLDLILPAIDEQLKTATGLDWRADNPVDPLAKLLANVLLVRWFMDPGHLQVPLHDPVVVSLVTQLRAKAAGVASS